MRREVIFSFAILLLITHPLREGTAATKIHCPSFILSELKESNGLEPWQLEDFSTRGDYFSFRVNLDDSRLVLPIAMCFSVVGFVPIFEIYGMIEQSDAANFESLLGMQEKLGQKTVLMLSGPGGDLEAALRIARLLQDRLSIALVSTDEPCLSACFFVLSGATIRLVGAGGIGIHSPYYRSDVFGHLPPDSARSAYAKLTDDLRQFFLERGMSPQIVDRMIGIPSTQIHAMSEQELRAVGFSILEPIFREHTLAAIRNDCSPRAEGAFLIFLNAIEVCSSGRIFVGGSSADCVVTALKSLEAQLQQQNCEVLAR